MRQFLAALFLCFTVAAPATAANVTIAYSFIQNNAYDGLNSTADDRTGTAFGASTLEVNSNGEKAVPQRSAITIFGFKPLRSRSLA